MGDQANNNPERKFSQKQYDMLKRCSDAEDMTEWNQWRKENPDETIWLQGRNFKGWYLQGADFLHGTRFYEATDTFIDFGEVHLEKSNFEWASLQKTVFGNAKMKGSKFWRADANCANFHGTFLTEAKLSIAHFENCNFCDAILENASCNGSFLNGSNFTHANLIGCQVRASIVNGATNFRKVKVNKFSNNCNFTDFSDTPLGSVRIDPSTHQ